MFKFIQNLFTKNNKEKSETGLEIKSPVKNSVRREEVTKPLPPPIIAQLDREGPTTKVEPGQLIAGVAQSVGKQREHNEDSLFSLTTTFATNASNLPFGLYIVADGMGGHQHGEIASAIAVRAMAEFVMDRLFKPLFGINPSPPEESLTEILESGTAKAHDAIVNSGTGGGTTLTTALILGNQMSLAHVGDSRIYSIDLDGKLEALTRDHSLVKRLEELGQITAEEAAIHPQRNVLYRALGQGEPFEPEIITNPLPRPGYLLICSDGLWGIVNQETIGKIAISSPNPHEACQRMVDAANEAGGPDNITAILVRLPD